MIYAKPGEHFELTQGEKMHPLWVRLKTHLENELQSARVRNDRLDMTEIQTAILRGRIQALRAFIALGDDRPSTGD